MQRTKTSGKKQYSTYTLLRCTICYHSTSKNVYDDYDDDDPRLQRWVRASMGPHLKHDAATNVKPLKYEWQGQTFKVYEYILTHVKPLKSAVSAT